MEKQKHHIPNYWEETIYAITYLPTGKKYVGRTSRPLEARLYQHYLALRNGTHTSKNWQKDYCKYGGGMDAFFIEAICSQRRRRWRPKEKALDNEKKTMLLLRTFDERCGYNDSDPSMQSVREAERLSPIYWHGTKGIAAKRKEAV